MHFLFKEPVQKTGVQQGSANSTPAQRRVDAERQRRQAGLLRAGAGALFAKACRVLQRRC